MAYTDFDLERVQTEFGLRLRTHPDLFGHVPPVPVSPLLADTLERNRPPAHVLNTEKARSELLIAPVLVELWTRIPGRVALYSGVQLAGDPDAGLVGVCDYLIGRPPQLDVLFSTTLVAVVEAKRQDLWGGTGQCVAEMLGAQRHNRRRKFEDGPVYGCVTDGDDWRFLVLSDADLDLDLRQYAITAPDRLLGLFAHFLGIPPADVPAA